VASAGTRPAKAHLETRYPCCSMLPLLHLATRQNIEQLKRIITFTCPALVGLDVFSLFLFSTHRRNTNKIMTVISENYSQCMANTSSPEGLRVVVDSPDGRNPALSCSRVCRPCTCGICHSHRGASTRSSLRSTRGDKNVAVRRRVRMQEARAAEREQPCCTRKIRTIRPIAKVHMQAFFVPLFLADSYSASYSP